MEKKYHYKGNLIQDEQKNSDWFSERSEFCNMERLDGPVTKQHNFI